MPIVGADFEARQAIARCRRLLESLGDDDRALFVLRYVEKMELTEVAAALAWSLSKTKRRLARVTARVDAADAARSGARRVRHRNNENDATTTQRPTKEMNDEAKQGKSGILVRAALATLLGTAAGCVGAGDDDERWRGR